MPEKTELIKLSDIQDRLRDRIKLAFMDLIPDAKWDELIKKEIEYLMRDTVVDDGYGRNQRVVPSELRKLVQELVLEGWKAKLNEWNQKHASLTSPDDQKFNEAFSEFVVRAAQEHMMIMGKTIVFQALDAMRQLVPQQLANLVLCKNCNTITQSGRPCVRCGNFA